MLEVRRLSAAYGRARVLFDVELAVAKGEVVALLGRNGAGKSTTLKSIMGLVEPRGGEIRFEGARIDGRAPHQIARLGLGYVPEDRRIFTDLTVMENLDVARRPPRDGVHWTPEKLFNLFPNLQELRDRPGGRISGGEQQMLTVARTLMGNPLVVLLDEPSEGVAPLIVERMAATIQELKKQGLSILLSEQNLHFAELVSDRVYLLEKGHVGWAGTMKELSSSADVQRELLTL
jgi:branched-chain amino acid transport system ATP-binding protein